MWMAGTRETQVRLDGWSEGDPGQQRKVEAPMEPSYGAKSMRLL